MYFRMTDEQSWQYPFEAQSPEDIPPAIRAGWIAYIQQLDLPRGADGVHPRLAFKGRKRFMDNWLEEKLDDPRLEDRPELEDEWRQSHRGAIAKAKRRLGQSRRNSPLYLHVKFKGNWYTMGLTESGHGGCAPNNRTRVAMDESDRADKHWRAGKAAIDHAKQFEGLADFAAKNVAYDPGRDFEVIE